MSNNINKNSRQRGAALITALMFLIIMTMLALTSMGTNTLEERMASNSQQINRSFQAAEAGINLMISVGLDPSTTASGFTSTGSDYGINDDITVTYTVTYSQETPVSRGPNASDQGNAFHHYDIKGIGTAGGIDSNLHAGVYKTGPSS
jgi:Tfp pilus assembly protein PilV